MDISCFFADDNSVFTNAQLREFQKLWLRETGERISDEDAERYSDAIVQLGALSNSIPQISMVTPTKGNGQEFDVYAVLNHLGFNHEADLMSCPKYEDRRLLIYGDFNAVWDEQKNRPYLLQELVMELLGIDTDAATKYLAAYKSV